MFMRKILFFVAIALIAISCEETVEDNRTECQKENIGYIKFSNTSSDAYDVFVNNVHYKQQPGNTVSGSWLKYAAGKQYNIKVQQVSGYIFTPTVRNYTVTLNQCDEKTVTFP